MRTVAEEYDCVVGVDTHAATHTMTLLTATGGVVEHRTFPTSAAGLHRALAWIRDRTQTRTCLVVVEGTGSYGAQLTEHFTQGGILVAEAPTVPAARHRGKDDVLDSARIARTVLGLRLDQLCWPRAGGTRTAIRVLVSARDHVTGEAILGLADLEAKERERCANFAGKAVAAGLAERTVRIAERQGQLMVEMVQTALREVNLSPEQALAFKAALARQARELTEIRP